MIVNFSEKEEDIICDAGQLLFNIILTNNLEKKYQNNELKRNLDISFSNYNNLNINPMYLYIINNYLYWYTHIDDIPTSKRNEDIDEIMQIRNIELAIKLNNKINNLLNTHLKSEIIYIDYDKRVEEICNEKKKYILEKLGNNTQKINLYPTIKKKILSCWVQIKSITASSNGLMLEPQYEPYIIYQEEK